MGIEHRAEGIGKKAKKLTADSPCGILPLAGSPEAKFHGASADERRHIFFLARVAYGNTRIVRTKDITTKNTKGTKIKKRFNRRPTPTVRRPAVRVTLKRSGLSTQVLIVLP